MIISFHTFFSSFNWRFPLLRQLNTTTRIRCDFFIFVQTLNSKVNGKTIDLINITANISEGILTVEPKFSVKTDVLCVILTHDTGPDYLFRSYNQEQNMSRQSFLRNVNCVIRSKVVRETFLPFPSQAMLVKQINSICSSLSYHRRATSIQGGSVGERWPFRIVFMSERKLAPGSS